MAHTTPLVLPVNLHGKLKKRAEAQGKKLYKYHAEIIRLGLIYEKILSKEFHTKP